MKNFNFTPVQEEISLVSFVPKTFLKKYSHILKANSEDFSLEENLILIVLDRDGYFYSGVKPEPVFLLKLYTCGIYVKAFGIFNNQKRLYSCFLKTFIEANPKFKPTGLLKNM